MPSRKLSNSELLTRRLRHGLFEVSPPSYNNSEAAELLTILTSAIAQLPPSATRELRGRYTDLFCPFCGALHPLSSCTHPGVTEYRLDPHAWMHAHIPAGLQQHMAHIEVKPKRVRIAQKQSKTPQRWMVGAESCSVCHESELHKVTCPWNMEGQQGLSPEEVSQGFAQLKEDIAKVPETASQISDRIDEAGD